MADSIAPRAYDDDELSVEELDDVAGGTDPAGNTNCVSGCGNTNCAAGCGPLNKDPL
ncbi:hypothetical protein [Longimicrobium sp.]|uniref:hypothetical protein n=1 Tax=Longimicrobium sp. TaxID=2029185 RepID=UPI002B5B5EFA|nr:hypothetical protein [Longimicrobium sp.]HSU14682.1 hypothetical protein [Longimicrobium sp.]